MRTRRNGSYATLTGRERDVYALSVKVGCTASEVAEELQMEADTARKHLTRIYRAFGVKNHPRLIVAYWKARLARCRRNRSAV